MPVWVSSAAVSREANEYGINEWDTNLWPTRAHSMMYYLRDTGRKWCERCCELGQDELAVKFARRHERMAAELRTYQCPGCDICPADPGSVAPITRP